MRYCQVQRVLKVQGNARLYGMEEDLGLQGNQYQTAVSILFVTYLMSELPSNLVLKKFRPSRWISFITTSWSVKCFSPTVVRVQSLLGFKGHHCYIDVGLDSFRRLK